MSNVNQLRQYNGIKGKYDRLVAKLNTINKQLENWDQVKAATWSDMPAHHDTENGDKIGAIVVTRENRKDERGIIEYQLAELSEWIIDVDSKLECLEYSYRYLLVKTYKEGLIGKRMREKLYTMFVKDIKYVSWYHLFNRIAKEAEIEFNKL